MSREEMEHSLATQIRILTEVHKDKSLAEVLFRADCARLSIESIVDEVLNYHDIRYSHFAYDWYDSSIEIFGVGEWVPTKEQWRAINAMGFIHFWTHPGETKVRESERHYGSVLPP